MPPQPDNNRVFSLLGVYKIKPSLTVDSRPKGFLERKVTLLCHTHHLFDIFILCRGGNASLNQNCSHQDHNTFLISVSPGHRRTYVCFGSYKQNSYLWSLPSDPLEPTGEFLSYTMSLSPCSEKPQKCVRWDAAIPLCVSGVLAVPHCITLLS